MNFETMVRRGLGRAVIYARENDVSMHRDFLLDACLHNAAYDAQVTGEQSLYMADVVLATGDAESYKTELMDTLATPSDDYDTQVYEILRRIAKDDHETIRPVLYKCVAHDLANGYYYPAEVLIDLDGLAGFLFVLEQVEDKIIDPDEGRHIEWLFEYLEEKIGHNEAWARLNAAIVEHPTYERYAEMIRTEWTQPKKSEYSIPSYEQIVQSIATGTQQRPPFTIARWGKDTDDATVLKIAFDLINETDERRLAYYLKFFQRRAFPLPLDKLLELAEHKNSNLSWLARWALSHSTNASIRDLALKVLKRRGEPVKAIALLTNNFHDGDWEMVLKAVLRKQSDDAFHRIEMDVRDLFEAHPAPGATDALLALYERGPCTMCRYYVVERLLRLGPLPVWMTEECRYDAYERTRELAKHTRRRQNEAD